MAPKQDKNAVSFEEIIQKARERRKHQQFTTEFFQRTRQKKNQSGSGVGSGTATPKSRSLENRISSASGNKQNKIHKNRNAHSTVNGNVTSTFVPKGPVPKGPRHGNTRQATRNQQRAQITPAASTTGAYTTVQPQLQPQTQAIQPQANFSIRGTASGPCTVLGSNFAPGTTAADIQSAFEPEGGPMLHCVLVNTYPMVVAEMIFAERAGAEAVVAKFNNQKADGRILHIRISPNSIYGNTVPTAPMAMSSNSSYDSTREWANRERRERERKTMIDGRLHY